MNIRRRVRLAAPFLFAALCLALSGLVLRGQIAAHPKPAPRFAPFFPPGRTAWRVAPVAARRAVMATITLQLAAIQAGDGDKAWFYQSRRLRRNFSSGQAFVTMIGAQYPEFGHAASASFGPVLTDPSGTYASVAVTVRGRNGRLAPADYMLIREDGGYKVAGVDGGRAAR